MEKNMEHEMEATTYRVLAALNPYTILGVNLFAQNITSSNWEFQNMILACYKDSRQIAPDFWKPESLENTT